MLALVIVKPALLVVIVKNLRVAIHKHAFTVNVNLIKKAYLRYAFLSHSKFNCVIIGQWRVAFLMIRGLPMSAYLKVYT